MSKTKIKKKISFINYNGVIFITFLSHFIGFYHILLVFIEFYYIFNIGFGSICVVNVQF